jgi:hypothetical protein
MLYERVSAMRATRLKTENLQKKEFSVTRIILIFVLLCILTFGITLLLSAHLRKFIITFAENNIYFRSLNHEYCHTELVNFAILFIIVSILFLCCILWFAKIILRVYLEARKLSIPEPVWLFVFLCLFLFFYVRLNINIMPIIACWVIYRLGFINWLFKTFGKKKTKTALSIAGIAMVFFIIVMLLFKVTIIMDAFFGADQSRVFYDFTQVSALHERASVHPFYVLMWQSLYHLLCPLVLKTPVPIRVMICIFSGLNCGIFSLFISRITKSRLLNLIICSIMVFSFPQILHSSQILDAYIFTQSSILLMLLYFSFAFSKKDYNLPALLALSLFITGNNIAYLCIFAIFYIILLYQISESWRTAWNKVLGFLFWYIIIFSILLLLQWLFYGPSTPPSIFSMIRSILFVEGYWISPIHSISYTQYAKIFFNVILFYHLQIINIFDNIEAILSHGWIWALMLLIPVLSFRKITDKPLFIAVVASCVFLFLFHSFYGRYELVLYSPVIMCIYVSLFAFIGQILPKKMTIFICCPLLAIMIYINITGLYTLHCINQYVFYSVDFLTEIHEYEANFNMYMLNERIKNYEGKKVFLYRLFYKD